MFGTTVKNNFAVWNGKDWTTSWHFRLNKLKKRIGITCGAQLEAGGAATELSGGDTPVGEELDEPESGNGAAGDWDGLKVTPGFGSDSRLGAVKFATRTTMITNMPVATKILTILDLSTGEEALEEPGSTRVVSWVVDDEAEPEVAESRGPESRAAESRAPASRVEADSRAPE